jgi:cyanophycin synthetase
LGFDKCDVGAVLNISADHLGLKGIETVEDLAKVKSLVVEVGRPSGTSVLNADDPLTVKMAKRAGGRIVFFSMHGGENASPHLREHIRSGGTAVVLHSGLRGDMIALYHGDEYIPLGWTHEIPATLDGKAKANVANALAATAIAFSLDVPIETIREGLKNFTTSFEQSPGRLNIYDKLPFRVIVDYAHNPAGMENMADLVGKLRPEYSRVIGVMSGTGDRRDSDIVRMGELIGGMVDELIVKEDERRGRPVGECAELVCQGARASGLSDEQIISWMPEPKAVKTALHRAARRFGPDFRL